MRRLVWVLAVMGIVAGSAILTVAVDAYTVGEGTPAAMVLSLLLVYAATSTYGRCRR